MSVCECECACVCVCERERERERGRERRESSACAGAWEHSTTECVFCVNCLHPRATDQHNSPQGDKDKATSTDCGFRIPLLWKSHLRGSPIKSTPALYDIDRDGYNDILVASTAGELWAIHGESGHVIDNWPLLLEGRSFHGSPLLVSAPTVPSTSSVRLRVLIQFNATNCYPSEMWCVA